MKMRLLQRAEGDFHATVLRFAFRRAVAGDRVCRAHAGGANAIGRHALGDEPVSYTHLDVYKRQHTTPRRIRTPGTRTPGGHCISLLSLMRLQKRAESALLLCFFGGYDFPVLTIIFIFQSSSRGVHFFSAEGEIAMQRCGWVSQDPLYICLLYTSRCV